MEIGLHPFLTDETVGPADFARGAEERGFESIWLPEHTHIPVDRRTPYPNGGDLPDVYKRFLDPFVALATAASVTSRLGLGTAICLVIEHDPIVLAKEIATLDHLSGGRVLLGVGAGWNREEMANHGTAAPQRWDVLRERVEAMRAIWSADTAEYHGTHVDFDPIWSWPKPVRGAVPVLVGGGGAPTLRRVVAYGDGWIPPAHWEPDLGVRLDQLREMAGAAGRPVPPVTVTGVHPDPAELGRYEALGVSRAVIDLPDASEPGIWAQLDRCAALLG